MSIPDTHRSRRFPALLWAARILSVLLVGIVLLFVVGESGESGGTAPTGSEWVGLALFPFGVSAGLLGGWRWPVRGALISLGALGLFFAWLVLLRGDRGIPPLTLIFCVPSALYLLYGWVNRDRDARHSAV